MVWEAGEKLAIGKVYYNVSGPNSDPSRLSPNQINCIRQVVCILQSFALELCFI
jgi:hypothetical protein